jgi:hypothetical protein
MFQCGDLKPEILLPSQVRTSELDSIVNLSETEIVIKLSKIACQQNSLCFLLQPPQMEDIDYLSSLFRIIRCLSGHYLLQRTG